LAALLVVALVGGVTPAAEAHGGGSRPDWRKAVAAVASQPDAKHAQAYGTEAVTALTGKVSGSGNQLLSRVRADSQSAYVDGARFVTTRAGSGAYDHETGLAGWLTGQFGRSATGDAGQVGGLVGLLRAGRVSADVAVRDLAQVSGQLAKEHPWYGPKDPQRRVVTALVRARCDFAEGQRQLRLARPAEALKAFERAWISAVDGMAAGGVKVGGDADRDGLPDVLELGMGTNPFRGDTDGDKLTDGYEAGALFGVSLPTTADTDRDGVPDGAEDLDGDGLDAVREQSLKTDPAEADTDADGLTDGAEVARHTNPLKADTDGDGLLDGAEVAAGLNPLKKDTDGDGVLDPDEATRQKVTGTGGITATLVGTGPLAGGFSVDKVEADPRATGAPGQVGPAYDFALSAGTLQQAELTIPYDPAALGDAEPADLRLFYLDEAAGTWRSATDQQSVDTATHTVRATVTHFSTYAIFDIRNWNETWSAQDNPCRPRGGGGGTDVVLLDLALVLDSSGSMATNDPEGLRRTAAKNFVDALLADDRAAVVDFDDSAVVRSGLSSDKTAVKAAIDQIDDVGGTNLGAGVSSGLDVLRGNGDPARARMMIMLTDGEGAYDPALTEAAKTAGIAIYTIGLGSSVDGALLQSIADGTGGSYHHVATAAELPEVFRRISDDTGGNGDVTKDTDGDGLTDCQETQGVMSGFHKIYTSDPAKPDTDGDGLKDGEEAGSPVTGPYLPQVTGGLTLFNVLSDPKVKDSDGDGLDDPDEYDQATEPLRTDSDGDGLSDGEEVNGLSTEPLIRDTDGDKIDDGYENSHRADQGLDPLRFDVKVSKWSYASDFAKGLIAGDMWREDSLAWLAGNLASGGSSLIPGVGWIVGAVADVRDAIGSAIHADWVGSGLSALGVVPYAGDAVAIPGKAARFVLRNADKTGAVLAFVVKLGDVPRSIKIAASEQILRADWSDLRKANFTEDALIRLESGPIDPRQVAAAVRRSGHVSGVGARFFANGREGEEFLAATYHAAPEQTQKWFSTSDFLGKGRRVDVMGADRVIRESKVGYVRNSKRIRDQIEKDAYIIGKYDEVDSAHWHFFASARSNSIGADPAILQLLEAKKIPYTIHVPAP
jgi:Mg-chelatase subunit ChlD